MLTAFTPADWLPVQEGLLRGLNHALSNRLSSLGAIAMLVEGTGTLDERMQAAFASDVEKFSDLLTLYRLLPTEPTPRRDAVRLEDALAKARALLEHHPDCRNITFDVGAAAKGGEPVTLSGRDAIRAAVTLLLAVVRGAGGSGAITASVTVADGWVHVTARAPRADPAIAASDECAALSRFAQAEGGRVEPAPDSLVLVLSGLSRARAASAASAAAG